MEGLAGAVSGQTLPPFETVVAADGCPETAAAARAVPEEVRRRIGLRILELPVNVGVYTAVNTAAAVARGDLLTVFGADDEMRGDHLETMLKSLRGRDAVLARCDRRKIMPDGRSVRKAPLGDGANGVIMLKRSLFMEMNGYEPWRCHGDTEFVQRLRSFGYEVGVTPRSTMVYVKRPGGLTDHPLTRKGGPLRTLYKKVSAARLSAPARPDRLHVSPFREAAL